MEVVLIIRDKVMDNAITYVRRQIMFLKRTENQTYRRPDVFLVINSEYLHQLKSFGMLLIVSEIISHDFELK